jgi:transcriptional regulator with XRE-family HTH domain
MTDALASGVAAAIERIPRATHYELARKLRVSIPTVDRWKHGINTPRDANLRRIAELAGVTVEWIKSGGNK